MLHDATTRTRTEPEPASGRRVAPAGTRLVEARFTLEKPGRYRLRAATADLAGRSTVLWKEMKVEP